MVPFPGYSGFRTILHGFQFLSNPAGTFTVVCWAMQLSVVSARYLIFLMLSSSTSRLKLLRNSMYSTMDVYGHLLLGHFLLRFLDSLELPWAEFHSPFGLMNRCRFSSSRCCNLSTLRTSTSIVFVGHAGISGLMLFLVWPLVVQLLPFLFVGRYAFGLVLLRELLRL